MLVIGKLECLYKFRQVDSRTKNITRNKGGCFTLMKMSVHQDNITVINMYISKDRVSIYMKQN